MLARSFEEHWAAAIEVNKEVGFRVSFGVIAGRQNHDIIDPLRCGESFSPCSKNRMGGHVYYSEYSSTTIYVVPLFPRELAH